MAWLYFGLISMMTEFGIGSAVVAIRDLSDRIDELSRSAVETASEVGEDFLKAIAVGLRASARLLESGAELVSKRKVSGGGRRSR